VEQYEARIVVLGYLRWHFQLAIKRESALQTDIPQGNASGISDDSLCQNEGSKCGHDKGYGFAAIS